MTVDPRAASGFANSVDAYDRGRPSYPADALAQLAKELGLTRASTALDLGAGTGKLTRQLSPLVGRIIAVDPSGGMLAELRKQLPNVDARPGVAEAIPLADEVVDAVFVGEAFHWFRTADACREIARVLSAKCPLVLLWNRARWTEADLPWLAAFDDLVMPYRQAAEPFPAGDDQWKYAVQQTGLFAPLSRDEAEHVHRVSADGFVTLVASWSWIVNLPDQKRDDVLRRVRKLIRSDPVTLRYRTEIYWTRLI